MKLTKILNLPVTDDLLERLGFTDYDDEHGTWGNRRLRFGDFTRGEYDKWYVLQIMDFGDYPEDNDRPEGFVYAGWFEYLPPYKTNDGWDINTVRDLYKIIYLYHKQWLPDFKKLIIEKLHHA